MKFITSTLAAIALASAIAFALATPPIAPAGEAAVVAKLPTERQRFARWHRT